MKTARRYKCIHERSTWFTVFYVSPTERKFSCFRDCDFIKAGWHRNCRILVFGVLAANEAILCSGESRVFLGCQLHAGMEQFFGELESCWAKKGRLRKSCKFLFPCDYGKPPTVYVRRKKEERGILNSCSFLTSPLSEPTKHILAFFLFFFLLSRAKKRRIFVPVVVTNKYLKAWVAAFPSSLFRSSKNWGKVSMSEGEENYQEIALL